MDPYQSFLNLVVNQNSADNNVRKSAELEYNQILAQDPSYATFVLMQSSSDNGCPSDIRQSCLLHLRRLVPKYWSAGFQSFVGPPVKQELKIMVREELLKIATTSPISKLRAGSAYVIVQIASADYPDEWSNLLDVLYISTTKYDDEIAMIGGLTVLNDLFDDLITEEQFWEGGIGSHLINHIMQMLSQERLSSAIKSTCIDLYQSVLMTLQGPEAYSTPERKEAVYSHITMSIGLFVELLERSLSSYESSNATITTDELKLKTSIYKILGIFSGNFHKLFTKEMQEKSSLLIVKDFAISSRLLKNGNVVNSKESSRSSEPTSDLIIELLSTLSIVQHHLPTSSVGSNYHGFIEDLVQVSVLSNDTIEEYENDINTYITEITGLSSNTSVRTIVNDYLAELNDSDTLQVFNFIDQSISSNNIIPWQLKEALLFLLQGLFMNEDSQVIGQRAPLVELMNKIGNFISFQDSSSHVLVPSRGFLVLPRFFEKFEQQISVSTIGARAFIEMMTYTAQYDVNQPSFNLVKGSALVSLTFYKNFLNFDDLEPSKKGDVQLYIFQIALSLLEESEEDGLPALLEAITAGIDIDNLNAFKLKLHNDVSVLDLIYKVSFKDPANIQLSTDSADCLQALLKNTSLEDYYSSCEKSLPYLSSIIQSAIDRKAAEYSPELDLGLELLGITIISAPESSEGFSHQIFSHTFPLLRDLLLLSTDNQILQTGGEVFDNLVQKASQLFLNYIDPVTNEAGIVQLLSIVSKFLSPDLSDSAAKNCGSIVSSLISKFQQYLSGEFISQILEATVKRLLISKESVTIENLIMVFCNLVLNSPSETINFLSDSIKLPSETGEMKSGLELILPIWFDSFEVTRGYEKIKQNALALAKIFTLGDPRVEAIIVKGDIIPYEGDKIITRSMAKSMPEQYTQISAAQKILKLLVSEMNFQCQQPDEKDYLPIADGDGTEGGDEGWEDLEDIGVPNFDKLKSYVDSDASDDDYEDQKEDEGLKNILVQFFKECTTNNVIHFQKYYELLDDEEKKIITENLIF